MGGMAKGIGRMVLDPLNISGQFGSESSGPDMPSIWNGPDGFLGGRVKPSINAANGPQAADPANYQKGFIQGMAGQHGFAPDAGVMPEADFKAQWAYAPGKGPQWTEPQRVGSSGNYIAAPSTGPVKGNRI